MLGSAETYWAAAAVIVGGLVVLAFVIFLVLPPIFFIVAKLLHLLIFLILKMLEFLEGICRRASLFGRNVFRAVRRRPPGASRLTLAVLSSPIVILSIPFLIVGITIVNFSVNVTRRIRSAILWLENWTRYFFEWWTEVVPTFLPTQEDLDRQQIRSMAKDLREINQRMKPKGPHGW